MNLGITPEILTIVDRLRQLATAAHEDGRVETCRQLNLESQRLYEIWYRSAREDQSPQNDKGM